MSDNLSETSRLVKNTGIIALGGIATKAISFLMLPLYTALLTTEEYGTVDFISTLAMFCVPAVTLLMDETIFRFLIDADSDQEKLKVVTCSLVLCGAGCLAFILVSTVLFLALRYSLGLWVVLIVISSSVSTLLSSTMRGFGRTGEYSVFNFSLGATVVVLNVVLIWGLNLGAIGMLSATVVGQLLITAMFFVRGKYWRFFSWSTFDRTQIAPLLSYAIPLIPNRVAWLIMNLSSRLVIAYFLGPSANGIYAISAKFPTLVDTLYGFFNLAWKESSARALKSGDEAEIFYCSTYKRLRRLLMGVVLLLVSFMPLLFWFLIDDRYWDALIYVPVLLFAMYWQNISGFYGGIFTAYKETKVMGTTTVAAAVINLILNFALIPVCGLFGAAFATLIATFTTNFYRSMVIKRYVLLQKNRLEDLLTFLSAIAVVSCFVAYFYFGQICWMIASCAVSIVYFAAANRYLFSLVWRVVRKHAGKGEKNEG